MAVYRILYMTTCITCVGKCCEPLQVGMQVSLIMIVRHFSHFILKIN
jgi:hypothetical protein